MLLNLDRQKRVARATSAQPLAPIKPAPHDRPRTIASIALLATLRRPLAFLLLGIIWACCCLLIIFLTPQMISHLFFLITTHRPWNQDLLLWLLLGLSLSILLWVTVGIALSLIFAADPEKSQLSYRISAGAKPTTEVLPIKKYWGNPNQGPSFWVARLSALIALALGLNLILILPNLSLIAGVVVFWQKVLLNHSPLAISAWWALSCAPSVFIEGMSMLAGLLALARLAAPTNGPPADHFKYGFMALGEAFFDVLTFTRRALKLSGTLALYLSPIILLAGLAITMASLTPIITAKIAFLAIYSLFCSLGLLWFAGGFKRGFDMITPEKEISTIKRLMS